MDLAEARDLRAALQRAALGGVLTGEELRDVHDTLKATRAARTALLRQKSAPVLEAIARDLPVLQEMEKEIARAIGPHGEVLDSASPTLKELRAQARSAYQSLMDSLERTVRRVQRHNILQEPLITQRNGRMVLLLKSEMKGRLPGIVHDVSDSGATIFVEPMAAITLGNQWRELRLAEEREEERVVRFLSDSVEDYSHDLLGGQELLARLDLAMAKARYSLATDAASTHGGRGRAAVRKSHGRSPSAAAGRGGPHYGQAGRGIARPAYHRPQRRWQDGGPQDRGAPLSYGPGRPSHSRQGGDPAPFRRRVR